MLGKRHLVALAFASGCLSGATVIGIWRDDAERTPRDATPLRTAARQHEPAFVDPIDHDTQAAPVADDDDDDDDDAMDDEPVVPQKTAGTDAGNSLAEVLLRLEAAYRLGAAAAQSQSAATSPLPLAPEAAAHQVTAVAVVTPPAAPTSVPMVEAPPPRRPEPEPDTAAPQRVASRDDVQPRDVYNDQVQQNTNVGSAHQGDVYYVQNAVPYAPYYAVPNPSRFSNAPRYGVPVRNQINPAGSGAFNYPVDGVFKYPVELVH